VRSAFRVDIPPEVAGSIRSFVPELKKPVKAAMRAIAMNPECGEPLRGELAGLWKYRVRRFRIVYEIDRKRRTVRVLAVRHRRQVYEEIADRMKKHKPG